MKPTYSSVGSKNGAYFCFDRWWERYRTEGLAELLKQQKPVGQACKVTAEAWEGLLAAMRKGHMVTMEDARDYYAKYGDITKATRVTALRPTIASA